MKRLISTSPSGPRPGSEDRVMLLRPRKSRIYYLRRFFDYPDHAEQEHTAEARSCGGLFASASATLRAPCSPSRRNEPWRSSLSTGSAKSSTTRSSSLIPKRCGAYLATEISAEWGAQRIKGLSVWATPCPRLQKSYASHTRRLRAEEHRDFADRAVSLSQVRPRPDVGRSSPADPGKRRRNPYRLPGGSNPYGWLAGNIDRSDQLLNWYGAKHFRETISFRPPRFRN